MYVHILWASRGAADFSVPRFVIPIMFPESSLILGGGIPPLKNKNLVDKLGSFPCRMAPHHIVRAVVACCGLLRSAVMYCDIIMDVPALLTSIT